MKINEISTRPGNTSVSGVLDIMASDRKPFNQDYCHWRVSRAIKTGKVDDNDYVLLLGEGNSIAHSVVVNDNGDVKVDSYNLYFLGVDDGIFYYEVSGQPKAYKVIHSIPVSKFKQMYLNQE